MTGGQNRFDVESHRSFGRIGSSDDGEAEALLAGAFFEDDGAQSGHDVAAGPSRQSAKFRRFFLVESRVDDDHRRRRRRRRRLLLLPFLR